MVDFRQAAACRRCRGVCLNSSGARRAHHTTRAGSDASGRDECLSTKGIQPRDAADFNYWVDHISQSGGLEKGYANEGGTGTWIDRMASGSGGVGDYGQGGGGGQMTMGGGMGMSDAERSAYTASRQAATNRDPYGGGWDSPEVPAWLKDPYHLPTQRELECDTGLPGSAGDGPAGARAERGGARLHPERRHAEALERYGQDYASERIQRTSSVTSSARGSETSRNIRQNQVQPGQYKRDEPIPAVCR